MEGYSGQMQGAVCMWSLSGAGRKLWFNFPLYGTGNMSTYTTLCILCIGMLMCVLQHATVCELVLGVLSLQFPKDS